MHLIRSLCWKPHWIENHLSPSYHCKCQLLPNMYSITNQSHVLVRTTGFSCFWLQRSQRIAATLRFFCGASAEPWRCRGKREMKGTWKIMKSEYLHDWNVKEIKKYRNSKKLSVGTREFNGIHGSQELPPVITVWTSVGRTWTVSTGRWAGQTSNGGKLLLQSQVLERKFDFQAETVKLKACSSLLMIFPTSAD